MRYGQMILEKERSVRLFGWGIRFFLAAALTAGQTADGYAPFALGFIAICRTKEEGVAALLGAAAGAVLFLDFSRTLAFLAAGVLILTTSLTLRELRWLQRPAAMPMISVVIFLVVEGIYIIQSLSPLDRLVPCGTAAGLLGASAWLFRDLFGGEQGSPCTDSVLFLIAALLMGLIQTQLLGISIGRVLLCLFITYLACERGMLYGVSVGLGLGFITDLCLPGGGLFTGTYALGGFLAGHKLFCRRGTAALGFLAGVLAIQLPLQERIVPALILEAVCGAGLFAALPGRLFGGKRIRREEEVPAAGTFVRERLGKIAAALRDVYDSMGRSEPTVEENPSVLFDRTAEQICRECALCQLCWQKEYTGTFNALNDATPFLLERGRAMAKDFPQYFSNRCIHFTDFLGTLNRELSAFLLRQQYRRRLEETRRSAKGQYAQLSDLLSATAVGLTEEPLPVSGTAETPCRVGAVLRPKDGENICGDTVLSFQNACGDWRLMVVDGMGSGEAAQRESALTSRLLRQFLEAEIEPEAALKTLNAAMALRGAETGSFTTVDLCLCRNATGELTFYKFGAAPSYLKKGGSVRRITGVSLPVGLRGMPASPDVTRTVLEPGSFAVMVSDGVADPSRDEWLQDLLAGWSGSDPQILASVILTESMRRQKLQDDCAVQVLYRPAEDLKKAPGAV